MVEDGSEDGQWQAMKNLMWHDRELRLSPLGQGFSHLNKIQTSFRGKILTAEPQWWFILFLFIMLGKYVKNKTRLKLFMLVPLNMSVIGWIVYSQKICWSPNSRYPSMWPYLKTGSLKM